MRLPRTALPVGQVADLARQAAPTPARGAAPWSPLAPPKAGKLQPAPAGSAITPDHRATPAGRPEGTTYVRTADALIAALPLLLALTPLAAALLALAPLPLHAAKIANPPPAPAPLASPQIQTQPAQPPPSELPKIVEQLAAQPALSASDCEKLARETLTYGQGVRQAGQPVKPGIVQDGLAAVDRGEALDPKASDWPELRSQIQALHLPPPQQDKKKDEQKQEEQKKEQQKQDQQKNQQSQDEESQDKKQEQQQQQEQKSEEQKQQEQRQQAQQPKPEPPQNQDTQQVGGEKPKDDEAGKNPELAVPLQKLEQVRDKDSPAELFELLHDNEPHSADRPKKDW